MVKQGLRYKKKMMRLVFLWLISNFQFSIFNCSAQERKTLPECIAQALESNYSIKIVRNEACMAKNDLNYSTFLPTLEATAKQNQTRNDSKTEDRQGVENKLSDVKTDNYSAGVALNWRLFDGLEMFTTREKQKELLAMGELAVQQAVENLIVNVSAAYYNVLVQHHKLQAALHSLEVSNERYEEAQARHEIGNRSGLEARQAKIDLNTDSSAYMKQREALKSAYISLNKLMNTDLQSVEYVRDTILLGPLLVLDVLEQKTLKGNTALLMAKKDQRISALDLKNSRAVLFPTLDFNSGYNYNKTEAPSSNTTLNRTNGFYWGFSLNVPIFSRLQNRTKIKNAKIELENAELSYQEAEKETLGDLALLYNAYENNLLMVNFENESANVAAANLDAALVKYKIGSLSGIEFREFQRSYIDAVDRKLSAIYQAKVSELSLLLLSGEIRDSMIVEDVEE